jgi:DNA ligase-1
MEFKVFAEVLASLESTSKRLEKTKIIEDLLGKIKKDEVESVLLLLEGRVFPIWSEKNIGIATKLAIKAISTAFGRSLNDIEQHFKENGDLGLTAEKFVSGKKQQTLFSFQDEKASLTVKKVFNNFKKIAEIEGDGTVDIKIGLVSELLNSASSIEAKYIIRIAISDLRVGVAWSTIRDAVAAKVFPKIIGLYDEKELKDSEKLKIEVGKYTRVLNLKLGETISSMSLLDYDAIVCENYEDARRVYDEIIASLQHAYDTLNEGYKVVLIAEEKGIFGLNNVALEVMAPLKAMLMQKVKTVSEAVEKIPLPFALEYKYDGFRAQCHKKGNDVKLFTRNMENVTLQFPDVVEILRKHIKAKEIVLDGEILGIDKKTGKFLAFQNISQRIKRKYDIAELVEKIPVIYATWDVLFVDGKSIIDVSQNERRKILIENIDQSETLRVSEQKIITNVEDGEKFYALSLAMGNEGVVVKDLNSVYQPGNRVGCWLKLKPTMDPLDLVIIGAEWGEGKRAKWLTSFIVACRKSGSTEEFLEIGRVGTGFKELAQEGGTTFEELTNILVPLIDKSVKEKDKTVAIKPKLIVEIAFEEIQKSPTYSSGYALRFPRFVRVRDEMGLSDVSDLTKINDYFEGQ